MKRSRLRSKPSQHPRDPVRAGAWRRLVLGRPAKPCAACGAKTRTDPHHVLSQEILKRVAREQGLDVLDLIYDERNGMALCSDVCHPRHTNAFERVPRSKLTPANWDFARELKLEWVVERYYPA